jgi:hypothetical protein
MCQEDAAAAVQYQSWLLPCQPHSFKNTLVHADVDLRFKSADSLDQGSPYKTHHWTSSRGIPADGSCLDVPSPVSMRYSAPGVRTAVQLTLRSMVGAPEDVPSQVMARPAQQQQERQGGTGYQVVRQIVTMGLPVIRSQKALTIHMQLSICPYLS